MVWDFIVVHIVNRTLYDHLEITNSYSCDGKYFTSERSQHVK